MSCFRADKSIAKRLSSTCLPLGDTGCDNKLRQSANQTCPIDAEAVSSHRRMLTCPFMSRSTARIRKPCSTPLTREVEVRKLVVVVEVESGALRMNAVHAAH